MTIPLYITMKKFRDNIRSKLKVLHLPCLSILVGKAQVGHAIPHASSCHFNDIQEKKVWRNNETDTLVSFFGLPSSGQ